MGISGGFNGEHEIVICVICKKQYMRALDKKPSKSAYYDIRHKNTITCSKKCAFIYESEKYKRTLIKKDNSEVKE